VVVVPVLAVHLSWPPKSFASSSVLV
jgi:hypothetical protein